MQTALNVLQRLQKGARRVIVIETNMSSSYGDDASAENKLELVAKVASGLQMQAGTTDFPSGSGRPGAAVIYGAHKI